MKRFFTLLAFVGILFLLKSCGLTYKAPEPPKEKQYLYTFHLDSVTLNGETQELMKNFATATAYTDSIIGVKFQYNEKNISVLFHNKTASPIFIDWDMCGFVTGSNATHKIIHKNVKYIDKDKPQGRSMIAGKSYLNEVIVPTNHVLYSKTFGWVIAPIISSSFYGESERVGLTKQNRVILCFERNGKQLNYDFTFNVTAHDPKKNTEENN